MASFFSFWIFSFALALLASHLLKVARYQSDSDEAVKTSEEAGDFGDPTFTSAPVIDTITVFPNNSAKLVKAGGETELLVGVKNNGESSLNVVAIKASIYLLVKNLTSQVVNKGSIPPSAQATFPYIFELSKFLRPGNFDLVGTIVYEIDGQRYQSTFYNGNIKVLQSDHFRNLGYGYFVIIGIAIVVMFGTLIYCLIIQHLSKGTAFAQSQLNKSKKKK